MPDLRAAEKLTAACALVAAPRGWTQGYYAKDARGRYVDEHGPLATCFCPMGALFRVRGAIVSLKYLRRAIGERSVPNWNDQPGRTQAEVVAAFGRAIEFAEASEETANA